VPERAFLDANVLFTAAISPEGAGRALFRLARTERCTLLTTVYARDEALRNVRVKRPDCEVALGALLRAVAIVEGADVRSVAWAEALLPAKDAPILAAAVEAGAGMLVTGDRRHFGALFGTSVGGVTVLPPRAALERLLDD